MDWTKYKNFLTRSLPNIFEVTGNENSTRRLACVTGIRINFPPISPSFQSPTLLTPTLEWFYLIHETDTNNYVVQNSYK